MKKDKNMMDMDTAAEMVRIMTKVQFWSVDNLQVLNSKIVSTIRQKVSNDNVMAGNTFKVGDKVWFGTDKLGMKMGTIEKMNRVKAVVGVNVTDMRGKSMGTMGRWNVPYSLMRKVVKS